VLDRSKLIDDYWERLLTLSEEAPRSIAKRKAELPMDCEKRWVSGAIGSAKVLAQDLVTDAVLSYKRFEQDPWPLLAEAVSILYWMNELDINDFVQAEAEYDGPDSGIYARCFLHGMALQTGHSEIADWMAPFMLNMFRHGGWFDKDGEFGRFYQCLLEAQIHKQWPSTASSLGGLAPEAAALLRAASAGGSKWTDTLTAYCDWRLARANRYPDMASSKKAKNPYAFETSWWGVFPFELFAVQAIYAQCSGQQLQLDQEHPLLTAPWMHPPQPLALPSSQEATLMQNLVQQVFGAEWQALRGISLI
jgi:hypothetical protein